MMLNEKTRYAKARLDGAIMFEQNLAEAKKWRKTLTELEAERKEANDDMP